MTEQIEHSHIRYHALAMIAGLPKLDRHFYERDIEAIITEARSIGVFLYGADLCSGAALLTDEQANAVRVAFHTQDFQDIDAGWLECYDERRASGSQPSAGIPQEAWWD